MQVWAAVIARCLLHVVYEFQAFLTLFAQQALGLSAGMAAQVRTLAAATSSPASRSRPPGKKARDDRLPPPDRHIMISGSSGVPDSYAAYAVHSLTTSSPEQFL